MRLRQDFLDNGVHDLGSVTLNYKVLEEEMRDLTKQRKAIEKKQTLLRRLFNDGEKNVQKEIRAKKSHLAL